MSRGSILRLSALACIWGASFLLIKIGLEGLSPVQIVIGRLAAGAAVLIATSLLVRQRLAFPASVWGHLAVMGLVGNIIPQTLFGFGELRITSGLAGILNGATPLFTLAFAAAALREERFTRTRALGFAIGFAGVVLVIGPWDTNPLTSSISGQLACLAAAASYAVGFVYTRRFLAGRGYASLALATGQTTVGLALLLLVAPFVATTPVELTGRVVLAVAALGAASTGFAYLLYYRLVADAGATSASMVTYLIPVVAVVLGVLVLAEPVTWNLFVGAAVVIAGVATAEGRLRRRRPSREPPPAVEPTVDAPLAGHEGDPATPR